MGSIVRSPMTPLVLFSIGASALLAGCLAAGRSPPEVFEFLLSVSWTLLLWDWISADARRRRRVPCFDFGFLSAVFYPLSVPWYCFWSRGWRGAVVLMALTGLWLLPYFVAGVVWLVLYSKQFV